MKAPQILVTLSGSIACYKTCILISKLVQNGFEVKTVCTPSALQFVGKATLEGLSGHPVRSDIFEEGQMMDHIHLARWADLIILCPATANTINKLAHGIADDWVTAVFLANNFRKPYWIAPAMNTEMYEHPATAEALKKLKGWGAHIFETVYGQLACGEVGSGKLVDPEDIFGRVREFFHKKQ